MFLQPRINPIKALGIAAIIWVLFHNITLSSNTTNTNTTNNRLAQGVHLVVHLCLLIHSLHELIYLHPL